MSFILCVLLLVSTTIGQSNNILEKKIGELVTISCNEDFPVHWCYPKIYDTKSPEKNTVSNNKKPFYANLTIDNMMYSDTGFYYCVTDEISECTRKMEGPKHYYIKAAGKSNILIGTIVQELQIREHEDLIIPCIPNKLEVKMTLKHGDIIVYSSFSGNISAVSDFQFDINKGFTLERPTQRSSGNYTCFAEHNGYNDTRVFIVKFERDTGISIKLESKSNKTLRPSSGSLTTVFKVGINSVNEVKLDWYGPNDKKLEWDKENKTYRRVFTNEVAALLILNVSHDLSGQYRLHAHNKFKEESLKQMLIVKAKPEVNLIQLQLVTDTQNQANFKCTVTSSPPLDVKWYFLKHECEDCVLEQISTTHHVNWFANVYEFTIVLEETRGTLKCEATNPLGIAHMNKTFISTDLKLLQVWDKYDEIVTGDTFNLTCRSKSGTLQWYYNNNIHLNTTKGTDGIMVNNESINNTKFCILTLHNVSAEIHDGFYDCYDNEQLLFTEHIKVSDPEALQITETNLENSTNMQVTLKSNVTLLCNSKGKPKPETQWLMNGEPVIYDTTVDLDNETQSLIIKEVRLEHEGKYTCNVSNRLNYTFKSGDLIITDKPLIYWYYIVLMVGAMALIALLLVLGLKLRREKNLKEALYLAGLNNFEEGALGSINPELTIEEQADLLPYDKSWEFPRDKLKLGQQLGSGAFGVVLRAEATGIIVPNETTTIAVKMVKGIFDVTIIKSLASELKIMAHMGKHLNVVNFLGACTKNLAKMELMIIVEFCHYGNLHKYLLLHRENFIDQLDRTTGEINPIMRKAENSRLKTTKENSKVVDPSSWQLKYTDEKDDSIPPLSTELLTLWAYQISCGMEYLSSRKVLHGDLATRNILLANKNIIKICDFGLSNRLYKKGYYRKKKQCLLPIKWMAPESLCDRVFSIQSDVWSFGIVLWEMFALAHMPYPEFDADDRLYLRLLGGYRMKQPRFSPDSMYKIMWQCWETRPSLRPTFAQLKEEIGSKINNELRKYYRDLNLPYEEMNERNKENDFLGKMCAPDYRKWVTPEEEKQDQAQSSSSDGKVHGYLVIHDNPTEGSSSMENFLEEGEAMTSDENNQVYKQKTEDENNEEETKV